MSRRGMYVTICKILLLLFCIWISHISLSNNFVLILKFYTVPVRLRSVTNFVNHETLQCKHVSNFFYRENMTSFLNYVTATLRALFAWRGSYSIIIYPHAKFNIISSSNINTANIFQFLASFAQILTILPQKCLNDLIQPGLCPILVM